MAEEDLARKRPQSSTVKSAYIRRIQSSRGGQVQRKLNFVGEQQAQQPARKEHHRFNEELQSVHSYKSKESIFKMRSGQRPNDEVANLKTLQNRESSAQLHNQRANLRSSHSGSRFLRNSNNGLSQRDYQS